MYTFDNLKTLHRQHREHFPVNLNLLAHCVLSWIKRAKSEITDPLRRLSFNGLPLMQLMLMDMLSGEHSRNNDNF